MTKNAVNSPTDVKQTLGLDRHPSGRKGLLLWVLLLAGVSLLLAAFFFWGRKNETRMQYATVEAHRGDLTVTVTATGTLEPTNQVDVGTEVSGTIETVEVDYNDFVKAGQILAKLDTTKLEAQVNQSQAALESARANLLQAEANVLEARNELLRLQHVRQLSNNKLPSVRDYDAAEAALKRAEADKARMNANIIEASAKLKVDRTNLEKAIILSPINGVVLKRSVEPGQTVAATLQAPVLFTLAEDLAQMELHVQVDEADVGLVQNGQHATFTVDAFPDRTFPARITQVRFGSQVEEGVVTYLTVLEVDNSDLSLRPGMTATADITVKQISNALLIPNAALRFTPPQPETKSPAREGGSLLSKLFPRPPRTRQQPKADTKSRKKQVWTLRDNRPLPVSVTTGATDGSMTEIVTGDISAGMALIVEAVNQKP